MAELVMYMGPSGCGKSTSLRDFDPAETVIISPNSKSLPFPRGAEYKEGVNRIVTSELDLLQGVFDQINAAPQIKTVILEDFSHYFSARIFSPAFLSRNSGGEAFQRWNDFGASVFAALFAKAEIWRDDLIIGVLHHTETKEDGKIGAKSSGKLLDSTIDIPSYFTYVFHGMVVDSDAGTRYLMQTNRDALHQAKSPAGAFPELRIPNNLAKAFARIREYKAGNVEATFVE